MSDAINLLAAGGLGMGLLICITLISALLDHPLAETSGHKLILAGFFISGLICVVGFSFMAYHTIAFYVRSWIG